MKKLPSLLFAVLLRALEPLRRYHAAALCLYAASTPEEIEAVLREVKANGGAIKEYMDAQDGKISELKARTLDLEQKLAHRPAGGSFGDPDAEDLITPALEGSDGFKALRSGQAKSARIAIPAKALQRKTITSTITGGSIGQADRAAVITAPAQRRLMVRDLLPSVPTSSGSTEFVRELAYTMNAGPQYDAGSPNLTEGAVKNASDMTLELVVSPVVTIAHHFTVSRQALDDSAALQQHIETRGIYGWNLELDDELLNGNGNAGNLSGLIHNAADFNRANSGDSKADTIRRAITQLALTDHVATGVVLNPIDVEGLELVKDTTGQYINVVVFINGRPMVWRVDIVESNTVDQGRFLVGDFAMAAVVRDRQEAHIEISLDHADYRTRNLALILIEGRVGLEIHRPNALVQGPF